MKTNIVFFAPLKNKIPSDKIGGAEMGCLKTLEIYEQNGVCVELLSKPSKTAGVLSYIIRMLLVPVKLLFILLKKEVAFVHIVGFYRNVVYLEWILMQLSRIRKKKVVYEVRNGSMVESFQKGSCVYKRVLKDLLLKPDIVLCQGVEYVDFIKEKWGVQRTYYPNFLQSEFLPSEYRQRAEGDIVRIVYFGRVTKSKNVLLMIDVLHILLKSNIKAELIIIGASNEEYQNQINRKISETQLTSFVNVVGRKNIKEIVEYLKTSHYFLFPTNEPQEGHSNSLTEAMGLGVVPVVSNKGFNASICGKKELVIEGFNPQSYAEKIIEIEKADLWQTYSKYVQDRVKHNFTQSIVETQLLNLVHKELI